MRGLALSVFLALVLTLPATGQTVEIGASGNNRIQEAYIGTWQSLAQQFTLNSVTQVNSIWFDIGAWNSPTYFTYGLYLRSALEGGTEFWSDHNYITSPTYSPSNLILQAGTYYLMAVADHGGTAGWWYLNYEPELTQVGGSVGPWWFNSNYETDPYWYSSSYGALQFRLEGASPVPEPSSLLLLSTGLLGLGVLSWRRRGRGAD